MVWWMWVCPTKVSRFSSKNDHHTMCYYSEISILKIHEYPSLIKGWLHPIFCLTLLPTVTLISALNNWRYPHALHPIWMVNRILDDKKSELGHGFCLNALLVELLIGVNVRRDVSPLPLRLYYITFVAEFYLLCFFIIWCLLFRPTKANNGSALTQVSST